MRIIAFFFLYMTTSFQSCETDVDNILQLTSTFSILNMKTSPFGVSMKSKHMHRHIVQFVQLFNFLTQQTFFNACHT